MAFKEEMVKDFESSLSFLTESMLETLRYISRGDFIGNKPSHTVQTEKFFSFYEKVLGSKEEEKRVLLDNLRTKVVAPVYDRHAVSFLNHLVDDEGKVSDEFLKVSRSESDSLKIRTVPEGIYFQISKVFLPISEVYTEAVKVSLRNKGENPPFPNKILLGLYSTVYHVIRDRNDRDVSEYFTENIRTLKESLDVCDEVKPSKHENGPMGMIKNMLGNIDFNQIGDMMTKVSGDEKSSKEFSDVFGKLSESIKNGGNPLEVMGDIIKQATVEAAESRGDDTEEETAENQPDPETTEPVAAVTDETELPASGLD